MFDLIVFLAMYVIAPPLLFALLIAYLLLCETLWNFGRSVLRVLSARA